MTTHDARAGLDPSSPRPPVAPGWDAGPQPTPPNVWTTPPSPAHYPAPPYPLPPQWPQARTTGTSRWALGLSIAAIAISIGTPLVTFLAAFLFPFAMDGFASGWMGPEPEGTVQALSGMEVGACFDTAVAQPDTVRPVPCTSPHDGQIYVLETLDGYGDAYPGAEEIGWAVDETCFSSFDEHLIYDVDTSDYTYTFYAPDERTWSEGDRDIACVVAPMRLGSMEGTALDTADSLPPR